MSLEGFTPVPTNPTCPQCGQPMEGPVQTNILNMDGNGTTYTCNTCAWTRTTHPDWDTPHWHLELDQQAVNALNAAHLGNTPPAIAYVTAYRQAWRAAITLTQNLEERLNA